MQLSEKRDKVDSGPVALCLSGGGFRATFFHLGVVRLLAEIGWLQHVRYVFSVSGGQYSSGSYGAGLELLPKHRRTGVSSSF